MSDNPSPFGEPIEPSRVSKAEKTTKQSSVQLLDANSAATLQRYMETAVEGLRIPQTVHETAVILWLIDEGNNLIFSLEEMWDEESDERVHYPRFDGLAYGSGFAKLGHPALIGGAKARIAGEIVWNGPPDPSPHWQVSNKSGRYGIRKEIEEHHLMAVQQKFQEFGIKLKPYYIRARET